MIKTDDLTAAAAEAARAMAGCLAAHHDPAILLAGGDDYPHALWQAIADAGLAGLSLGPGGYPALIAAARVIAQVTGCQGFASSYMLHGTLQRFLIDGFGTPAQKALLPEMAAGRARIAIAISEPGAGAHPKHLATRAVADGDGFVLSGTKAYVTNGPLASHLMVLAITLEEAGRKRFSCFLVPHDAPGLTIVDPRTYDFLKPAPHCELKLEEVRLGADAVIGPLHQGFETIAGPFRDVEDTVGTGPMAGGLRFLVDGIARHRAARGDLDDETAAELGALAARAAAVRTLSERLALRLEGGEVGSDAHAQDLIACRELAGDIIDRVGRMADLESADEALRLNHRDLDKSRGVARYARLVKLQRLGRKTANGSP